MSRTLPLQEGGLAFQVATALASLPYTVFPEPGPPDTQPPYIGWVRTFQDAPEPTFDTTGLFYSEVQLTCWATEFDQKEAMATDVVDAMVAYTSNKVRKVFFRGRNDVYDEKRQYHGSAVRVTVVTEES